MLTSRPNHLTFLQIKKDPQSFGVYGGRGGPDYPGIRTTEGKRGVGKFTLEHVMKDQRGSRGKAVFFNLGAR